MNEVFIGRQPILDRNKKIFGYELLFRKGPVVGANVTDNMKATAGVMVNTLNNIGINKLIGDKKGFVNVDAEIMASDIIDLLPKASTVLEILETVKITDEVMEKCKALRKSGYQLALDDFMFDESYLPMFGLVNYIKIDLPLYDRKGLADVTKRLRKYPIKLLAEKVEAREDFEYCLGLGFDYFQGYFFAKPSLITAKAISPTHIVLIELSKLLAKEEEFFVLEKTFKRNPELNFKLLKFINSASFYTNQKVSSIRHSIALLGYRNLQKWVTLLLYSGEGDDIKASPLLEKAAIRGRIMELLTKKITGDELTADSAFITGVLSLIDILFQMPIEQILNELNLSHEINDALVAREGLLGALLLITEKLEQELFEETEELLRKFNITLEELFSIEKTAIIEYVNYEGKPA
jgi:c-di-GMP phosphodiesterase